MKPMPRTDRRSTINGNSKVNVAEIDLAQPSFHTRSDDSKPEKVKEKFLAREKSSKKNSASMPGLSRNISPNLSYYSEDQKNSKELIPEKSENSVTKIEEDENESTQMAHSQL